MLPATKVVPKEMLPVACKPLIQYAIEEAAASGIETIIVVTRENKSLIQDHFSRDQELESFLRQKLGELPDWLQPLPQSVNLEYIHQKIPLGLAHAISCAQPLLEDEPFVVLLPDVVMISHTPVASQLISAHAAVGGSMIAVREVQPDELKHFGIVRLADSEPSAPDTPLPITGLVEKPSREQAPSRVGVFGRYLLEPSIWQAIAGTSPDPGGEVQLTAALDLLCQDHPLFGICFEGRHYDAGEPTGYLKANIEMSLLNPLLARPLLDYLSGILNRTE